MGRLRHTTNWNSYPEVEGMLHFFRTPGDLRKLLRETPKVITRGAGLSYGDASLSEHILSTRYFNKILKFDKKKGVIRCESGVTLADILKVIVPHGWFLPVTPGTKFITIGGAIAANIHGKNHHKEGPFSRYVSRLNLMLADGVLVNCSASEYPELFHSTCGGMGLTGVIMEAELKLKRIETSYIHQRNLITSDLRQLVDLLKANKDITYSVAWIDCLSTGKNLGRGVIMLGEHVGVHELPDHFKTHPLKVHDAPKFSVPFKAPSFVLNRYFVKAFNASYYFIKKHSKRDSTVHYNNFFYPLDVVSNWNYLYGRRGFLQYQFVLPFESGDEAFFGIVKKIAKSGYASFLTVLKLLGEGDPSVSFPLAGYTLALDLPINSRLFAFLDELDKLVADNGGRVYLAKDARTKSEVFRRGYSRLNAFNDIRNLTGAHSKFESLLSRRLKL